MTDQEIDEISKPFRSFCVASGSREFDHLGFARALFSKAAQSIMNNATIDDIAAEVFGTMATHQERQFARTILSRAIPEGHVVVPNGWQLVPIKPTPEMLHATSWPGCAAIDYAHMLKVAPKHPAAAPAPEGEA